MDCRPGCGACCIAPSISSPIPGMPQGKASGERCIQLSAEHNRCLIFGHPDRPAVCASLQPSPDMCGETREQAMRWLGHLEAATQPLVLRQPAQPAEATQATQATQHVPRPAGSHQPAA